MDYGRAIRTIRTARGIQQKELAKKVGLDASYVSLIETGKRVPSLAVLEKIAATLQVPMHLLMLVGAGGKELRGISEAEADKLGSALMRAVWDVQGDVRRRTSSK